MGWGVCVLGEGAGAVASHAASRSATARRTLMHSKTPDACEWFAYASVSRSFAAISSAWPGLYR